MNAIVTACAPVEVKAQVSHILQEIGSSPTELINSAYNYVLANKALPTNTASENPFAAHRGEQRALNASQKTKLASDLHTMRLGTLQGYDGANYKELLNATRDERYVHFA